MKKLLLALCLLASVASGQLIISPAPTPGVSGGGGDALVANPLSQFATTTSAQLATVMSDETGSGPLVFGTAPTLTGATVDSGTLTLQGNQSAAAWTTNGIRLKGITGTLTDTSSSGTVAAAYTNKLGGNTIAASSATVFTNYISLYASAPVAGTNVTLTNGWALGGDSLYIGTSNPVKITTAGVLTATSPVLTTPDLGTPSAAVLTNATGLPVGSVTGLGTGVATFLATPSTANLAAAVTGETGTGAVVFATSPALVTPDLGVPSAGTLTNATGLPVGSGISGLGTGVATFLATPSTANLAAAVTGETGTGAVVFATSPTLVTPDLGTPSAGVLTSATGLPVSSGISGLGTGVATFLGTPSSANLITALTDETGSGAAVFATSPTLVTPLLGTPTSGTLTNCTGLPVAGITASTSTALGVGSIELGAASDTTIARSGAGAITVEGVAVPTISSTSTLTNKAITPRVTSISSNATWSPNADTDDIYEITAQAADATTISNPSGTPVNGQKLMIRVTGTAARALTWSGSQWRASSDLALPTTTTTTKTMYLGFVYNSTGPKWDLVAQLDNF